MKPETIKLMSEAIQNMTKSEINILVDSLPFDNAEQLGRVIKKRAKPPKIIKTKVERPKKIKEESAYPFTVEGNIPFNICMKALDEFESYKAGRTPLRRCNRIKTARSIAVGLSYRLLCLDIESKNEEWSLMPHKTYDMYLSKTKV